MGTGQSPTRRSYCNWVLRTIPLGLVIVDMYTQMPKIGTSIVQDGVFCSGPMNGVLSGGMASLHRMVGLS